MRIVCPSAAAVRQKELLEKENTLTAVGDHAFALWRCDQLLPAVGNELGGWSNPLEAGAAAGVDFAKGCFIGQEVIARLENYEKVQRVPMRLRWTGDAPERIAPGVRLEADGKDAGFVTTHVFDPRIGAYRGIGLIRSAYCDQVHTLHCITDDSTSSVVTEP